MNARAEDHSKVGRVIPNAPSHNHIATGLCIGPDAFGYRRVILK